MEYQFQTNLFGQPVAKFSMGHEAFGSWFSEELATDSGKLGKLLNAIERLKNYKCLESSLPGREYHLTLSRDEAEVRSIALELPGDGIDNEEMDFYDDELQANCGLDDFQAALLSWQAFVVVAPSRPTIQSLTTSTPSGFG